MVEIDKEKLMEFKADLQGKYIFTVDYQKGANHGVPDALSRNPINDPDDQEIKFTTIAAISATTGCKDIALSRLEKEAVKLSDTNRFMKLC